MRINNVFNMHFKSVVPVVTKKGNLESIKRDLEQYTDQDFVLKDFTSLYEKGCVVNGSFYPNLVKTGKFDVGFLVAGDSYKKWVLGEGNWNSKNAPLSHVSSQAVIIASDEFDCDYCKLVKAVNEECKVDESKIDTDYYNWIMED